jgi:glutamine synthetase
MREKAEELGHLSFSMYRRVMIEFTKRIAPAMDRSQFYKALALKFSAANRSDANVYRGIQFEAPNEIKVSAVDRDSIVRIPIGNEKSSRVEVRSVAPDANPYMVLHWTFRSGLSGKTAKIQSPRQAQRYLPENIHVAIEEFRDAAWSSELLGEDVKARYVALKQATVDRCPRLLGTYVKTPEIQFHHEVYNQFLGSRF